MYYKGTSNAKELTSTNEMYSLYMQKYRTHTYKVEKHWTDTLMTRLDSFYSLIKGISVAKISILHHFRFYFMAVVFYELNQATQRHTFALYCTKINVYFAIVSKCQYY